MDKHRLLKICDHLLEEDDYRIFDFERINDPPYNEIGRGKFGDIIGDFPIIFSEWSYREIKGKYVPVLSDEFRSIDHAIASFLNLSYGEVCFLFYPISIGLPYDADKSMVIDHIKRFISRKENGYPGIISRLQYPYL